MNYHHVVEAAGAGALAGGLAMVAVVAAAAAVHAWARRDGGVGFRHSLALAVAVYAITWGSFVVLGPRGAAMFAPVWLPVLLLDVVGIGLVARLFGDVVAGRAAEGAREGGERIRDIVARMNRITQVEEAPQIGALPPILDLKKSSDPS